MKRLLFIALFAIAACHDDDKLSQVHCSADADCPFQQCCAAGLCIDPGLVGSCTAASAGKSSLSVDNAAPVVGFDTVMVTALVRDSFGRPESAVAVAIVVSSGCSLFDSFCNTLSPPSGTTDANGQFVTHFSTSFAEVKNLALQTGSGTLATASVNYVNVGGDGTLDSVQFDLGQQDLMLGSDLSSVTVGPASTNPGQAGSSVLVQVQLAPNAAGVVLTDSSGAPLTMQQLTFDIGGGPQALANVYVPIAGYGFVLTTTLTSDPSHSALSDAFVVHAPQISAETPTMPTPGQVTVSWSYDPPVSATVRGGAAFIGDASPATGTPTYDSEGNAAITIISSESRPSPQRTMALLSQPTNVFEGAGDIIIDQAILTGSSYVVVAGEFSSAWTITNAVPAVTLTQQPVTKISGSTSFVARFDESFELQWYALLESDTGTIRGLAYEESGVVVLADYSASASAAWLTPNDAGSFDSCTLSAAGSQRGAALALINSAGDVSWCESLVAGDPQSADVSAHGAVVNGHTYVGVTGSKVRGVGASSFVLDSNDGTADFHLIAFDETGAYDSTRTVEAPYPFELGGIAAGQNLEEVVVFGGATATDESVLTGGVTSLTTVGKDAVVIDVVGGSLAWSWHSGLAGDDTAGGGGADRNGNVAFVGFDPDPYVTVLDASPAVLWRADLTSRAVNSASIQTTPEQVVLTMTASASVHSEAFASGVASSGQAVALFESWTWDGAPLASIPVTGASTSWAVPMPGGAICMVVSGGDPIIAPLDIAPLQADFPSLNMIGLWGCAVPYDYAVFDVSDP